MNKLISYQKYLIPLSFVLISYLVYSHTLYFDFFIFDDHDNIFGNPRIINSDLKSALEFWQESLTPLIFNVWQIISSFFGYDSPAPYRFINIICHGANSYLVYLFYVKICDLFSVDLEKKILYICALLFLVHPAAVESVVWLSSLRALLTTTFALLFALSYLFNDLALDYKSILFFALSILINPISGGIIFMIPITNLILKKRIPLLDLFGLALFLLIFFFLHSSNVLADDFFSFISIFDRGRFFIVSLAKYLEICILPLRLSFDYHIEPTNQLLFDSKVIITSIISTLVFLAVPYLFAKKKNYLFILCLQLCFLAFLSLNLGIFLHDFNNLSIVANRYVYMPNFPLLLLLVFTIYNIFQSKFPNLMTKSLSLILIFFLSLTIRETLLWKSQDKLLATSAINSGETLEMLMAEGSVLLKNQKNARAELVFLKAAKDFPRSIEPLSNLADLYLKSGDLKKIRTFLDQYEEIINRMPPANDLTIAKLYLLIENKIESKKFLDQYIEAYGPSKETDNLQVKLNGLL